MEFRRIRLQDFRNIEFADLELDGRRHFLLGQNGQGKSNLLEALSLVTALRSFRTQKSTVLPRKGSNEYRLVYAFDHEVEGRAELEIHSGPSGRSVEVDGVKVTRLMDFIGRFPVVSLCSSDLMLLRGSPGERRRFLDLTLSVVDRRYYTALRDFHRGIAERNRLLKTGGSDAVLSAFEAEVAPKASMIASLREKGISDLGEVLCAAYNEISSQDEMPSIDLKVNTDCKDTEGYLRVLREGRERDRILGATQRGPHRDDFLLSLKDGGAREYASDGQQRGLCVALRIAQAMLYQAGLNVVPVLLADDVLGELDPERRQGFWRACPKSIQVIATGTELPEASDGWQVHQVRSGQVSKPVVE